MNLTSHQRDVQNQALNILQQNTNSTGERVSHLIVIRSKGGGGLSTCMEQIVQGLTDRYLHIAPDYLSSKCRFHELFYQALGLQPEAKSCLSLSPSFLVEFIRLRRIRVIILDDAHCFHEGEQSLRARLIGELYHAMAMLPEVNFIISEAYPDVCDWVTDAGISRIRHELDLKAFVDLKEYMQFARALIEGATHPRVSVDRVDEQFVFNMFICTQGNLDMTVRYLTLPLYEIE